LVPHHGRSRHDLHRDHGARGVPRLDRASRAYAADAVDPHDGVSVSVHRRDRRLADGGAGTAAVAHLRSLPNGGGLEPDRSRGDDPLHVDRLLRSLRPALRPLPLPDLARDCAWTAASFAAPVGAGGRPCLSSGTGSPSSCSRRTWSSTVTTSAW